MNSAARQLTPLLRTYVRNLSNKGCKQTRMSSPSHMKEVVPASFAKLKQKQKSFQIDDGAPVWLKTGVMDKLLYQLSWVLVIVGTGLSVDCFWKLAVPQS